MGSLTAEAVVMQDDGIRFSEVIKVKPNPEDSARLVMEKVLDEVGLSFDSIDFAISTGYGRERVSFADDNISEISCHGKGAHWLIPSLRTVLDIGGQDCKAIRIDEDGELVDFLMNDKCAAGTGRYLENMSDLLEVSLDELGALSLSSNNPIKVSRKCSLYAQDEVSRHLTEGVDKTDLAAGVNKAMASRMKSLAKKVGMEPDIGITGGVAKNKGVVKFLEEMIGEETKKFERDPQIVGALGAAVYAKERYR